MKDHFASIEQVYESPDFQTPPLELRCPNCNLVLAAKDLSVSNGLLKCTACEGTYQIHNALPVRQKPTYQLPKEFEVYRFEKELNIQFSWRPSMSSAMLIFTLLWNGLCFLLATTMIWFGGFSLLLLIGIPTFVGICLLYFQISQFFNQTNIIINDQYLLIKHSPIKLPGYGNQLIDISIIQQIFVEKYIENNFEDHPEHAFSINALLKNNEKTQLIKRIGHLEQARYLEQEMEDFLLTPDQKIDVEFLEKPSNP